MKKLIFFVVIAALMCCLMAFGVSAATTDEFGTAESLNNIDLTGMNTDTAARVVILTSTGYRTFPSSYVVTDSTTFCFNFKPISDALGETVNKASVIRIEIPSNILVMPAYGATTVSQSSTLREIKFLPDSQLTTLGYGCFFQNTNMQRLNIPKNVNSISTLVVNKSKIEEIVFEDGFCAPIPKDSFCGVSGLKKMVFSNQMTTIADGAFDSTLGEQLEEFYVGMVKDVGVNNMAYAKRSLKIYAHSNFLSELDVIERSTFTWWNGNSLPKGVVFYTGTYDQVMALVKKSTPDSIVFVNPTVVEWNPEMADDDYMPASGWVVVYNYNLCNACYQGQHVMTGEQSVVVTDYFSQIKIGDICTREGCGMGTTTATINPVFEFLGYSYSQIADANGKHGVTMGYKINYGAYNELLAYGSYEYGFVASAVDVTGKTPLAIVDGEVVAANAEKTIVTKQSAFAHNYVDVKVTGLDASKNGRELVMTMYVFDGKTISYLNDTVTINVQ